MPLLSGRLLMSGAAVADIAEVGTAITKIIGLSETLDSTSITSLGMQEDDLLMVALVEDGLSHTDLTSTNSGFTDAYARGSAPGPGRQVIYKTMSSTPDTEILVTTTTRECALCVRAFRNVHATPLDDTPASLANGSSSAVDPPAYDVQNAGSLRMIFGFVDDLNDLGYTAPSGFGGLIEAATTTTGDSTSATLVWAIGTSPSSTGSLNPAAFGGVTPSTEWTAGHLALRRA